MSLLNDKDIIELQTRHQLINPFFPEKKKHWSKLTYGLGPGSYDVRLKQDKWLWPKQFFLGSTIERFNMPNDVQGKVFDKSSIVRMQIRNEGSTLIDAGWEGYLTLELRNGSWWRPVRLSAGQPIAQIVFEKMNTPAKRPYVGVYQNQVNGPVKSKWKPMTFWEWFKGKAIKNDEV